MPIEENDMINMRAKMSGFIFPNVPISDFERAAFERAVNYQNEHERQRRAAVGMSLPEGVTSVAIGHFSASFDDSAFTGKLTRKTICDAAYSELLLAGLLYRGLEGRMAACP